jgi:hypothetical protein
VICQHPATEILFDPPATRFIFAGGHENVFFALCFVRSQKPSRNLLTNAYYFSFRIKAIPVKRISSPEKESPAPRKSRK